MRRKEENTSMGIPQEGKPKEEEKTGRSRTKQTYETLTGSQAQ